MISRISGILKEVKGLTAVVDVGGICYNINTSVLTIEKLKNQDSSDGAVEFFTLHYIEGNTAMGNLTPRLVGFLEEAEREFFEVLTKVKGFGIRKTLNAMVCPVQEIAMAIETGDTAFLRQLPEIGARTADRIVAEIKGKMAPFVHIPEGKTLLTLSSEKKKDFSFQDEAKQILLQLGYKKNEIDQMIKQTLTEQPQLDKAEELVQAIFRNQAL